MSICMCEFEMFVIFSLRQSSSVQFSPLCVLANVGMLVFESVVQGGRSA